MDKYKKLEKKLGKKKRSSMYYHFADIEKIIEEDLPKSAYKRKN